MKKKFCILLAILLLAGIFSGCNNLNETNDKLSIVTTIFPEYDWIVNVLGDKFDDANVTMLLDNGVDLHSFQPTASDVVKISSCDLFIYVGGESDTWVDDALKEAKNKDMLVLNLLDVLGDYAKEEEIKEGMQEEHEEDEEESEFDEHVWLSLKNATIIVDAIKNALIEIDPSNAESYSSNANSYIEKLNALNVRYQNAVDARNKKTVLFGDRFPFRYLVDDYGLDYYAAFAGCSAESEASFETIKFLADKVDELSLSTVLTLEGTNHRIAETIISSTTAKSAKILSMDSMQSTTLNDVKNGVTYLSVMEKNLEVLSDALK